MARHAHEMQCTNCNYFNYPMLSDSMTGNYTIICGNCKHCHYRHIKNGIVTEDRHNHAAHHGDTIHVPRSATQQNRRKLGTITQLRQQEAAGIHG